MTRNSHETTDATLASCLAEAIDSPGYSARMRLQPEELSVFRSLIDQQWLGRIGSLHPELAATAREMGISRYHELADRLDHDRLWPKSARILQAEAVTRLKALPFFARLREAFGPFAIAEGFYGDTHIAGLEEIYWRLVRPGSPSDVGPLHADFWFHDMMGMKGRAFPAECFTVKIWIPIYCEPGRNGLLIVPGSHLREWKYSVRQVNGQPKPQFDDVADPVLVRTEPGQMLIFHERTLHGGAVNRGDQTRVSAEITMVFASEAALRARLRRPALVD